MSDLEAVLEAVQAMHEGLDPETFNEDEVYKRLLMEVRPSRLVIR
jgi:hypothetical protein